MLLSPGNTGRWWGLECVIAAIVRSHSRLNLLFWFICVQTLWGRFESGSELYFSSHHHPLSVACPPRSPVR